MLWQLSILELGFDTQESDLCMCLGVAPRVPALCLSVAVCLYTCLYSILSLSVIIIASGTAWVME